MEHASGQSGLEQFNVADNRELNAEAMDVRPGNILVAVRDPRNLYYLHKVLAKTDTTKTDVVVMTSRVYHREHSFSGSEEVDTSEVFRKYEQELFTPWSQSRRKKANTSRWWWCRPMMSSRVSCPPRSGCTRRSSSVASPTSSPPTSKASSPATRGSVCPSRVRACAWWSTIPQGGKHVYMLGPHTPRMRQEDVDLLHGLWKEVTSDPRYRELHHYHILNVALQEMEARIHDGGLREDVLKDIYDEMERKSSEPIIDDETPTTPPT